MSLAGFSELSFIIVNLPLNVSDNGLFHFLTMALSGGITFFHQLEVAFGLLNLELFHFLWRRKSQPRRFAAQPPSRIHYCLCHRVNGAAGVLVLCITHFRFFLFWWRFIPSPNINSEPPRKPLELRAN